MSHSYSLDETDYPSATISDDASGEVVATFHASDYGNYRDNPAFQTFIEGIIATKGTLWNPHRASYEIQDGEKEADFRPNA
ncbi:hypothetical protein [Mesorhizobium sp. SP-1A]|uniref:hypothetical protein n=1 Tax=Mesorhizobium sp. SP-1A TaxID=3077840 RepID=UPI0028F6C961|nr:hypothetical protein [Mesorhizobium sp. SP-1A]